jgi:pimeloyl-ACP methyl ester carboxylesterase
VHDYIWSVIKEDGPYDGVIGFSEGAALAASLLLCHEHEHDTGSIKPGEEPRDDEPFKVAIFFNSVVMLSPSERIGSNITQSVADEKDKYIEFLHSDPDESVPIFGFLPSLPTRITIPTLHVIGEDDDFAEYSRVVVRLCFSETAEVFVHDGGHGLPHTETALNRCAERFEAVITLAVLGGS